jgi:preprotein translocase subunit Sec61beta
LKKRRLTMLKSRALILAKIESVYGTDPTPTAAANAILCEDPNIEPVSKSLERGNVKSYFGARDMVKIGEALKITFTTELRGSGAAGTAPEVGPLLRACNMTETVTPATSVAYAPNSSVSTAESVTIWFYRHDLLHKATGCRGTFSIDLKAGEYGKIKWEFTGLYAGPIDAPIEVGTFNTTNPARFVSATFSLDTYEFVIETLNLAIGNEIGRRPSANAATGILEYFIKERKATAKIDPEAVALSSGAIKTLAAAPTAGGTGYAPDDVLTITTGGTGGRARVLTAPGGVVGTVQLIASGSGYTTGTGKATAVSPAGGTGCTLNITAVYGATEAKQVWTMWSGNSRVALAAVVGSSAGNICTIGAPKAQVDDVKYGERESLLTYDLPLVLTPNSGNDELTLTFT